MTGPQPISPRLILVDGQGRLTSEGFRVLQAVRDLVAGEHGVSVEELEVLALAAAGQRQRPDETAREQALIGLYRPVPRETPEELFYLFQTLTGRMATLAQQLGEAGVVGPDLAAIEALTGTGIPARIADDTWALRTITGTAGEITVTNGNGVVGNPTLSLPVAIVLTGKTIDGGTFTNGAFNGTIGSTTPATGVFTTVYASNLINAAGGQIQFPAAQVPAADPNTLDDYEEGTWTPSLIPGSGSLSSGSATGRYTKVGNRVSFDIVATITTNGTAASNLSATLPFTNGAYPAGVCGLITTTGQALAGYVPASQAYLTIWRYDANYPGADSTQIVVSGSYSV